MYVTSRPHGTVVLGERTTTAAVGLLVGSAVAVASDVGSAVTCADCSVAVGV